MNCTSPLRGSNQREQHETGRNETLASAGGGGGGGGSRGGGARAHLVHNVRVGLQRDPALPHLVGARRRKKESGGA